MRFAFINDNKIVDIIETDSSEGVDSMRHLYQQIVDVTDVVPAPQIGWLYDNGRMYRAWQNLSPRQIRLALVGMEVDLTMIEAALESLPEPTRSYAKISWEYSVEFERQNELVTSVAALLGWTDDNLDMLWEIGATL